MSVGILGTRHSLSQKHASEHVPGEAFLESKECRVFEEGQHSLRSRAGPAGPAPAHREGAPGRRQGWGRVTAVG